MAMIEQCPLCGELLEIPPPKEGGPVPGELIRCSTCGGTFVLGQGQMRWGEPAESAEGAASGFGGAVKRLFFQLGSMVTGFVSALLMLMVIVFWAFMMFLLGWVFGDEVFGLVKLVFNKS